MITNYYEENRADFEAQAQVLNSISLRLIEADMQREEWSGKRKRADRLRKNSRQAKFAFAR